MVAASRSDCPRPLPAADDLARLRFAVCRGDQRAMGAQQGAARSADIAAAFQALLDSEEVRHSIPRPLSPRFVLDSAAIPLGRWMSRLLAEHAPEQWDRLLGIASAGGVARQRLLLGLFIEGLTTAIQAAPGCSTIAVTPSRAAEKRPWLARNFDLGLLFAPGCMVRESRPARGYASLDVTMATHPGSHTGLNEQGLAITIDNAYVTETPWPGVPTTILVQQCLERFATTGECVDHLRRAKRGQGQIVIMADLTGNVAAAEFDRGALAVREPDDGLLIAGNRFHTEAMRPRQHAEAARFGRRYPPFIRGMRIHESSECREARLHERLDECGAISERDIAAALSDKGESGEASNNTVCRRSNVGNTLASMILDPAERRMLVTLGPPDVNAYVELTL